MSATIKNSLIIKGRDLSTLKKGVKLRFKYNNYWLSRFAGENVDTILLHMHDPVLKRPYLEYLVFKTKDKVKYFKFEKIDVVKLVEKPKGFEDINLQVTLDEEVETPDLHEWIIPTFGPNN